MGAQIPGVTGFLRPGAYVKSIIKDIAVSTPSGIRVVAIIGPGEPIQENFTRITGKKLQVSYAPIYEEGEDEAGYPDYVLDIQVFKNSVQLVEGTDFTIDSQSGEIFFTVALEKTDEVSVQYHNFIGDVFIDPELMKRKHGQPSATNLVSLGALIAFENGANAVVCINTKPTTSTYDQVDAFRDVLALPTLTYEGGSLFQVSEADLVVPMIPSDLAVYEVEEINYMCKQAVEFASTLDQKKEMVAILGSPRFDKVSSMVNALLPGSQGRSLDKDGDDLEESIIDVSSPTSYGTNTLIENDFTRTAYVGMDFVSKELASGELVYLNGSAAAAALAGKIGSYMHPAVTATNKDIVGFKIPRSRKLTRLQGNRLMDEAKVIVLEPNAIEGAKVIWALTTDNSGSPTREELSVVLARDWIVKQVRSMLEVYVGELNLPSVTADMSTKLLKRLETYADEGIIEAFKGVRVDRHPIERRQVNVTFQIKPAYPINWISVEFTIGTAAIQ